MVTEQPAGGATSPPPNQNLSKRRFFEKKSVVFTVMLLSYAGIAFLLWIVNQRIAVFPALAVYTLIIWMTLRSDRRRANELSQLKIEYREEKARFQTLIESMDQAVVTTDANGRIDHYNQSFITLLGAKESLRSHGFNDVLNLRDAKQQPVDLISEAAIARQMVEHNDLSLRINQNEVVQLRVKVAPLKTRRGGYIIMIRDITTEKSLDDERTEFVSVTSHELRTPIAVIEAGLATLMADSMSASMKPEAVKLINTIHARILHLGKLVQDLSTLARAQGQFLDIEIKPIDPKSLATQVKVAHEAEASEKGINLLLHPMLELHPVLTSPNYVHEIIDNYVSNAIKYTKQGSVSIGAENAPNNAVRFWVEDSGIGVSKSDQKKLFTKFFRVEDFHTRQTEGTGLGLYIVKKMADRIGAKVWCASELGKGSIFYLEVPPVGALHSDARQVADAEIKDFANTI